MSDRSKRHGSGSAPPTNGKDVSGKDLSDEELVPEELGLSPELRQELLRRIRGYFEHPNSAIPLEEATEMIMNRLRGAT